ncbi:hypothetical protein HL658_01165 [Azospirillum sp. RWY-5-1]|uniref:Uncharacterized protein n=1 Tax=Azospirillum oleiclasticum TaxID=2735135 RepID=A0ABX2T4V1_9PROT|nr:hypothetical protein [Azospirillum oleiclasticum]NYZ11144.1 hypothetical protein [Azospirillum oleiclasticum]NYZ18306.1 hypothetical protein [Azospirillum oleiclasticum]
MPSDTLTAMSYDDAYAALEEAHKLLAYAHAAANTAEDKDLVFSAMTVIYEEMAAILRLSLEARSADYQALTPSFKAAAKRLEQVKREIDRIVKAVGLAAKIVGVLDRVLSLIP